MFARHGWYEQDRFYGGHITLDKDFDGIYFDTEDMTSGTIYAYWKDQDSTEWELLGNGTENDFRLRWDIDGTTRPNSKWIRIGFLFRTDDEEYTPILRAHSTRFHTMVADRWRWTLQIAVNGNEVQKQEKADGTMSSWTGAEMKTHLETLLRQTPPLVYEDIDGIQYEAKVTHAGRSILKAESRNEGIEFQYIYNVVLDQVTSSTYS